MRFRLFKRFSVRLNPVVAGLTGAPLAHGWRTRAAAGARPRPPRSETDTVRAVLRSTVIFPAVAAALLVGCGESQTTEATRDLLGPISDGAAIADDLVAASNANRVGLDEVEFAGQSVPDDIEAAQDELLQLSDADAQATADVRAALRSLDDAAQNLREVASVIGGVRDAAVERRAAQLRASLGGLKRATSNAREFEGSVDLGIDKLEDALKKVAETLGDQASEGDEEVIAELRDELGELHADLGSSARVLRSAVQEEGVSARGLLARLQARHRIATALPDGACTQIPDDELDAVIGGGLVTVYPKNLDCETAVEVVRAAYASEEYREMGSGTYLGFSCATTGTFENFITECSSGESGVSFTAPGSA